MSARRLRCNCGRPSATTINGKPMCLEHASLVISRLTRSIAA